MNVERMIAYYEKNGHWLGSKDRPHRVLPYLSDCTSVLDVGCGEGQLLVELLATEPRLDYTGIDCVPKHWAGACGRFPLAEFLLGDFLTYDFGNRRFDAVAAITLFSGDGWDRHDIFPAVAKMWWLAEKKIVIYYNAFREEFGHLAGIYGIVPVAHSEGDQLLCLEKSSPAGAVGSP